MTQLTSTSQSGLDEFNPFSESSQLVRVAVPRVMEVPGGLWGTLKPGNGIKGDKNPVGIPPGFSRARSPWAPLPWMLGSEPVPKSSSSSSWQC